MSCEIDAESLRGIARMVADPCDVASMRAVCREWRAIIAAPVVPRMTLAKAWKCATKFGFGKMAQIVSSHGARDLQRRVLPRVTIAQCAEMWNARFAKDAPQECRDLRACVISHIIRAIAHDNIAGDYVRITREIIARSGLGEFELLEFLEVAGMFMDESLVLGLMETIVEMGYGDGDHVIIRGAIEMQRRDLLVKLIEIKCRTGRETINTIRMMLLTAGEYQIHSLLQTYGIMDGTYTMKHAAESGSREACIYARELFPEELDFGGMISGIALAQSDDTCRLAREWLEGIAQSRARIIRVPKNCADAENYGESRRIAVADVQRFMKSDDLIMLLSDARRIAVDHGNCEPFAYIDEWFADYEALYHADGRKRYGITHRSLKKAIKKGRYDLIDTVCRRGYQMEPRILEYARETCPMCYEVMLCAENM